MATKAAFSKHGLNPELAVDVAALSDTARRHVTTHRVVIATASGQTQTAVFTQNTTVKHNLGPIGVAGTLKAAYVSQGTLAAGGTLTMQVVAYDSSANAEIVLTDTLNPEAGTVREAQTFTIATTNTALAADDTLELHCAASNDAVSQDARNVIVTCVWEPTEAETSISR